MCTLNFHSFCFFVPLQIFQGKLTLIINVFISFLRNNCQMVRLKMIQSKMFHTSRCYCHCIFQNIDSFCCCARRSVLL
uniref:Candidate secreted effector n=1 Tax=Meloidogyne incognita TaxID=6306 RepID=A0A914MHV4_MELIC